MFCAYNTETLTINDLQKDWKSIWTCEQKRYCRKHNDGVGKDMKDGLERCASKFDQLVPCRTKRYLPTHTTKQLFFA